MRKGLIATVAVVLACAGCGYAFNNLYRGDIRTIYVEFLGNETFRRGLEVPLTRAVHEELRLRTPFILAPRSQADSTLTGRIVDADVSTRVKSEKDELLIQRARVRVEFRWVDNLTRRDIVPSQTVAESARVPSVATGEPFDVSTEQSTVFEVALQEAARRIVEKMEQSW